MSYDKTLILLLKERSDRDDYGDRIAEGNALRLRCKDTDNVLDVLADRPEDWQKSVSELKSLTDRSRLYIVGHGSKNILGGKSATELAQYLCDNGLRQVQVISLVSCNSGWSYGFAPSFGEQFHRALAADPTNIHTEVRARVGYVSVTADGRKRADLFFSRCCGYWGNVPKGWNKKSWTPEHPHSD